MTNFQCIDCGLCCTAKSDLSISVHLTDMEWTNLPERYRPKFKWQKNYMGFESCEGGARCKALKGEFRESVECEIYENRPQVCRDFEKGSPRCLQIREENKIGALI